MVDQHSGENSKDLKDVVIDGVEQAMSRLQISPRNILESLMHLRLQKTQIKFLDSEATTGGATGDVEAAILTALGESTNFSGSDDTEYFAVKKLRFDSETDDDRALAPFAHEVRLLSDLDHPNVVNIIGFVEDVKEGIAWMVFYWEKNGNLREFIRSADWELPERVSLIKDVGSGLNYLHGRSPPICHGDLKSLNILVNPENRAVITDFGSARVVEPVVEGTSTGDYTTTAAEGHDRTSKQAPPMEQLKAEIATSGKFVTLTGPTWTLRWAAPELLVDGHLTGLPSDIWAFGWICWEAITGNFPFAEEREVTVVLRVVTMDLPKIGDNRQLQQIQMLCRLMEDCWRLKPKERPSALRCQQETSYMERAVPWRGEGNSLSTTRSSSLLFALGRIQLRNGMVDRAQRYFEQSLEAAKSMRGQQGETRALMGEADTLGLQIETRALRGVADTLGLQGETSRAEELYIHSRDICSQIGDQSGVAKSWIGLGEVYRMCHEYSKAEASYLQCRDIYSQIGDQFGFARSIKSLGDVYVMRDEYAKAEDSYIQARDLFSELGNRQRVAQSVDALGRIYCMRGDYSKAEEHHNEARDIFSQVGDQQGIAQAARWLGDVYRMRREYSKAEESHIQARDIFSRMGNKPALARSIRYLADVYSVRGEYSRARESYTLARDIFSQINNQLELANTVQALGEMCRSIGEDSEAEECYIQARETYSHLGDQRGLAESALGLGDVYYDRNDYSKAEEFYIHSRDISSRIGYQLNLAHSILRLGHLHRARGEYCKAEESYLEARQIYCRFEDATSLANSLWFLGCVNSDQSRYEQAERLVREAETLYTRLGLEQNIAACNQFFDRIRQRMNE